MPSLSWGGKPLHGGPASLHPLRQMHFRVPHASHAPVLIQRERRGDLETLKRQNVLDCVECGSCAYTCPGCLPLVHSIRTAKQKLRTLRHPSRPLRRPNRKEGEPCRVKSSIFMS